MEGKRKGRMAPVARRVSRARVVAAVVVSGTAGSTGIRADQIRRIRADGIRLIRSVGSDSYVRPPFGDR